MLFLRCFQAARSPQGLNGKEPLLGFAGLGTSPRFPTAFGPDSPNYLPVCVASDTSVAILGSPDNEGGEMYPEAKSRRALKDELPPPDLKQASGYTSAQPSSLQSEPQQICKAEISVEVPKVSSGMSSEKQQLRNGSKKAVSGAHGHVGAGESRALLACVVWGVRSHKFSLFSQASSSASALHTTPPARTKKSKELKTVSLEKE